LPDVEHDAGPLCARAGNAVATLTIRATTKAKAVRDMGWYLRKKDATVSNVSRGF
jgi:hypothetical protein